MVRLPADNPVGSTLRKSASLSSIRGPKVQVPTGLVGSAAYSFGKPRHRKGCFKIPTLDPRQPEFIPGYTDAPGAGAYEVHDTVCRHDTKYGHPQCRKAPGYMWSSRTEPRDIIYSQAAHRSDPATTRNRFTSLSHVRSDSFLDVPGPGTYNVVHEEGLRHRISGKNQSDMPSYTMRSACKKDVNLQRHPVGPGPFEYDIRHKQKVSNHRQPTWIIPKHKRVSEALLPFGGTPSEVGPGKYDHAIALHSKFPHEEPDHKNVYH